MKALRRAARSQPDAAAQVCRSTISTGRWRRRLRDIRRPPSRVLQPVFFVPTNPAGASRRQSPCKLTSAPVTRQSPAASMICTSFTRTTRLPSTSISCLSSTSRASKTSLSRRTKRPQIEDIGVQTHTLLTEFSDAPSRKEKIAATITRDEACHRRMIVRAETHDHVLDCGNTSDPRGRVSADPELATGKA